MISGNSFVKTVLFVTGKIIIEYFANLTSIINNTVPFLENYLIGIEANFIDIEWKYLMFQHENG